MIFEFYKTEFFEELSEFGETDFDFSYITDEFLKDAKKSGVMPDSLAFLVHLASERGERYERPQGLED